MMLDLSVWSPVLIIQTNLLTDAVQFVLLSPLYTIIRPAGPEMTGSWRDCQSLNNFIIP